MKKIISIIFMAVILLLLPACSPKEEKTFKELPYNAKLFDKAENILTDEFLSENETYSPALEEDLPESRCHIISNDDDFGYAFASFPERLDFSHDMLVIYQFTDIYYGFDCKLYDLTENEGKISIIIKHEMAERRADGARPPSTSMPIQRCLVIKLSDCSSDNIEVNLIYS